MAAQACIPAVLCALHNFMCIHDSQVDPDPNDPLRDKNTDGTFNCIPGEAADEGSIKECTLHDRIATEMWHDYLQVVHLRAQGDKYNVDNI